MHVCAEKRLATCERRRAGWRTRGKRTRAATSCTLAGRRITSGRRRPSSCARAARRTSCSERCSLLSLCSPAFTLTLAVGADLPGPDAPHHGVEDRPGDRGAAPDCTAHCFSHSHVTQAKERIRSVREQANWQAQVFDALVCLVLNDN